LVTLASEIEPKFTDWFDVAEQVSPYATAYRYPGEVLEPTEDEFKRAFLAASRFYDFVCALLPVEWSAPQN
jgi:hypothetical protein